MLLVALLFIFFTTASASDKSGPADRRDCTVAFAGLAAQRLFIAWPLPLSDDLLATVLGKPVHLVAAVPERPLTAEENRIRKILHLVRGHRRWTAKETELAFRDALQQPLSPFGEELRKFVEGKRFIDLGCGLPEVSFAPRILAEALGASEYVGVDVRNAQHSRRDEFGRGSGFKSRFVPSDIATFLGRLRGVGGNVFYVSGLEPRRGRERAGERYADLVKENLRRLSAPGDAVIVGDASPDFRTIPGFKVVAETETETLLVREADGS